MKALRGALLSLLAFWAVPRSVAAGGFTVCGRVSFEGKPLPYGGATLASDDQAWVGTDPFGWSLPHPGPTERSLVPVHDGRFCADSVAPGNYIVRISPLGLARPLQTEFAARRGAFLRCTVDNGGRTRLYDAQGGLVSTGPLEIDVRPFDGKSAPRPVTAALELILPEGAVDAGTSPMLLVLQSSDKSVSPILHWVRGPWKQGRSQESVSIPDTAVDTLDVWSPRWAEASVHPRLFDWFRDGRPGPPRATVRLCPAAALKGVIRLPDGSPFRPSLSADLKKRSLFEVRVLGSQRDRLVDAYVGLDGAFSIPCAPSGPVLLDYLQIGDAFDWAYPTQASEILDLHPGETRTLDIRLKDYATLGVDVRGAGAAAGGDAAGRDVELRVLGFSAGSRPEELAARLFAVGADIEVRQSPDGTWTPDLRTQGVRNDPARVAAGRYDFYLVERAHSAGSMSTRILARRPGVVLEKHRRAELEFSGPYPRQGGAGVSVRLRSLPSAPRAKAPREDVELDAFSSKSLCRADAFDDAGTYLGSAYAMVPFQAEGSAAEGGARTADPQAGSLALRRLAPGRYRLRFSVPGFSIKEQSIVLKEGETKTLEFADLEPKKL